MNKILYSIVDKYCPKFNKNVSDGCAKVLLEDLPRILDVIFTDSIRSLSPQIPLEYVGYRKISPDEEFKNLILNDNGKTVYDIAISDVYPVEYVFRFNGEEIRKPIYLLYCDNGNLLKISNTVYSITPVLSETVISPSNIKIFVRLLKAKIDVNGKMKNFLFNGTKVSGIVLYAAIVRTKSLSIKDNLGSHYTSIFLYPLGKYGLKETLKKYLKIEDFTISLGNVDHMRNEYNIWESTKVRPRNLKDQGYLGHDLKICVSKKYPLTPLLENLIYGIIYTFDVLPHEAKNIYEGFVTGDIEAEKNEWRLILGIIAYKDSYSKDRVIQDMSEHFDALEGYVDSVIQSKLRNNNIIVNDFFDLLMVIGENFNIWTLNAKEYSSDINNRYIDIVYYLLHDIVVGFNTVILNLNKRAGKKIDGMLKKEATKIMQKNLSSRTIFNLVTAKEPNLTIQAQNGSSTDLIYPKITALLED